MRLSLTFSFTKELLLPFHYNEIIQGLIYRLLDKAIAEKLHDEGFILGKRKFKLFTFSRLFGRFKREGENLKFFSPFKFYLSSPYNEMVESLVLNLLKTPEIKILENKVIVESVEVVASPVIKREVTVKMLSPLTVYSTLLSPDGKKKTYYYHPKEKEFSQLVKENLFKKYKAFYGKIPPSEEFHIEPLGISNKNEKLVIYKGFIIKGWMGKFRLRGNPELIKFSYEAGLGAKNSQGFGMWEILKK
jgi:CRISPR-associated endoribonuclease Cas6